METSPKGLPKRPHRHVVLVPCPLQGHLTPMFHLATLLHSSGFSITVIHIRTHRYSQHDPFLNIPDISVELIDGDEVGDREAASEDVMSFILALNYKCEAAFREVLGRVVSDSSWGRVSCIVHDPLLYFVVDAARDIMEIPRLVLRTSSAANFLSLTMIGQKAQLPVQEGHFHGAFGEDPSPIRAKDMPLFDRGSPESAEKVLRSIDDGTRTAAAIVWNTIRCLEQTSLDNVKASFSVPIFAVGPLHKLSADSPKSSLIVEDRSCIEWLDSQPPSSVIYVSTGSLANLTSYEMKEIALGLAESGIPFLWVTRDGLTKRSEGHANRDEDVAGLVGTRGKITKWAPQREVLGHRSVGSFWTHNGWNSTLESICEGVPMLCWPLVGDQRVAARLVTKVWRVGLELEVGPTGLERSKIARSIKRLMEGEESLEINKRAVELKEKVEDSWKFGGASFLLLEDLISFISFLQG